jgi:P27 family predicted phage terminase small subunit
MAGMGQRGPQKQPTQLRLLRGETRPSRLGHGDPVPRAAEPAMPEWFDTRHAAVWRRVTAEVRAMNMLHAADADVLVALVRAVCRMEDAARLVMGHGVLVTGEGGRQVRNPACFVEREAAEAVRRLGREFGLTPSGRADLGHGLGGGLPDPKDPARLLTPPG